MANYPTTLPVSRASTFLPVSGKKVERGPSGAVIGTSYYTKEQFKITVKHYLLDAAQKAALDAHWAAEKLNAFQFADPGAVSDAIYTVKYGGAPAYVYVEHEVWDATVTLVGFKGI